MKPHLHKCWCISPIQLTDEKRNPIPTKPMKPKRRDSEYVRKGTCSIFVFTEPLALWRHLSVRERRTKIDWAHEIKNLLDINLLGSKDAEYRNVELRTERMGITKEYHSKRCRLAVHNR